MNADIMNLTLFRLRDAKDENNFLSCFYTERPEHFLSMYQYMKEQRIPLHDASFSSENDAMGCIEDIDVYFGSDVQLPTVDIWIEVW